MDNQIVEIWKDFLNNKANLIRLASGFTFILFFCPFLQTCSNENIMTFPKYRSLKNDVDKANLLSKNQENFTYNVYELAIVPFINIESKAFLELDFYIYLILDVVVLLSSLLFYFSFKKNYLKILKLGIVTILLLLFYVAGLTYNSLIEEFSQIKYGCYMILVNLVVIFYLSNKLKVERQ